MMRNALIAAALAFSLPAQAADKGAPATLEQIMSMPTRQALSGCYAEIAASGTFLAEGDRKASGVIGAGCDYKFSLFVLGAGIRGFSGEQDAGAFDVRLGFAVNPNLTAYSLASWRARDWKINDVGQLYLGGGAETSLPVPGLSAFMEGAIAVSKFGAAATRDDISTLLGFRYRLQ